MRRAESVLDGAHGLPDAAACAPDGAARACPAAPASGDPCCADAVPPECITACAEGTRLVCACSTAVARWVCNVEGCH